MHFQVIPNHPFQLFWETHFLPPKFNIYQTLLMKNFGKTFIIQLVSCLLSSLPKTGYTGENLVSWVGPAERRPALIDDQDVLPDGRL
ncbi:MAG: hypothetical protein KC592_15930 [Nitrospira sp.]|nr:hypothetical protein [Nitrospira sp.]MCW5783315.1 hypothetical protein [Nitrospirales bacterium]